MWPNVTLGGAIVQFDAGDSKRWQYEISDAPYASETCINLKKHDSNAANCTWLLGHPIASRSESGCMYANSFNVFKMLLLYLNIKLYFVFAFIFLLCVLRLYVRGY